MLEMRLRGRTLAWHESGLGWVQSSAPQKQTNKLIESESHELGGSVLNHLIVKRMGEYTFLAINSSSQQSTKIQLKINFFTFLWLQFKPLHKIPKTCLERYNASSHPKQANMVLPQFI